MTVPYEPARFRENVDAMLVDVLACGVDPARSTLVLQSLVPEHTELAWLFACITPYAWLAKMTQFKDKARQIEETGASFSGGLLVYPLLMAADILLYKASKVPVGEDQDQHLELARDIARTFNARFGGTFGALCATLVHSEGESEGVQLAGTWLAQWLREGLLVDVREDSAD